MSKATVIITCDEHDTWTIEERIDFETEEKAVFFSDGFNKAIKDYASLPSNYTYRAELEAQ